MSGRWWFIVKKHEVPRLSAGDCGGQVCRPFGNQRKQILGIPLNPVARAQDQKAGGFRILGGVPLPEGEHLWKSRVTNENVHVHV